MDPNTSGLLAPSIRRTKRTGLTTTTVQSLGSDILCDIFSLLDLVDLLRCSAVCKSWSSVIDRSKLFQTLYVKRRGSSSFGGSDLSTCSESVLKIQLKEMAMSQHNSCLQEGFIDVYQWNGHSSGVNQCRLKMGLLLTGGVDKAMRLWSVESFQCLDEYCLPNSATLVDFDFDESKVVSLLGNSICVWRRNERRNIFLSRASDFPKSSCMCYVDPEAVVGCEDGRARVFDMYSRKWSRILKIHDGPVTCLSFGDDQLLIGGSTFGRVSITDLSSDQRVATLQSADSAGISTMCFNPNSYFLFAGSSAGQASCWDLRSLQYP